MIFASYGPANLYTMHNIFKNANAILSSMLTDGVIAQKRRPMEERGVMSRIRTRPPAQI